MIFFETSKTISVRVRYKIVVDCVNMFFERMTDYVYIGIDYLKTS